MVTRQRLASLSLLVAVSATLLSALGLLWPVLGEPGTAAVGLAEGEGPAHLWGLWVTAEGLLTSGPYLRVAPVNLPDGFRADLMDPINLLAFWPLYLLGGGGATGAVLGWNGVHLATVLLAGWGGWRLGRTLLESHQAAAVVAAAVAGAPYLIGAAGVVGRSEYLPLAGWALHLSFLVGSLRSAPTRSEVLGAILTLAALAHAGWQPLTWLILAEGAVVWMLWRTGETVGSWTLFLRLAIIVLPAALLTLPLLLTHLDTHPWWLGRLHHPSPFDERPRAAPLFALLPLLDTTRSWANNPLPYLGLTLPLLALIGAITDRSRAARWLLPGLVVVVFSMGEVVAVGSSVDDATGFYYMPAAILMHIIAPLRAFHGWARLTLLAIPLLALAAGHAIDLAARQRPERALLAAALLSVALVAEGVTWSPVGRGSFAITVPEGTAAAYAALPDGPVLELPLGMPQQDADMGLLRAQLLGRPTSLPPSPLQPAAINLSATAWSIERGTTLSQQRCVSSEADRLLAAGFVGIAVHAALLPEGDEALSALSALLGAPVAVADDIHIWRLHPGDGIPGGCESMASSGDSLTLRR
jgi:hypothetical protein